MCPALDALLYLLRPLFSTRTHSAGSVRREAIENRAGFAENLVSWMKEDLSVRERFNYPPFLSFLAFPESNCEHVSRITRAYQQNESEKERLVIAIKIVFALM